jgi:hypothetical protein
MNSEEQSPEGQSAAPTVTLNAADFPVLRMFCRGYLHQDMKDEYGSALEAVRAFCSESSPDERVTLATEWARFAKQTKELPQHQINKLFTRTLGSSYSLSSDDMQSISELLAKVKQRLK